MPPTRIVAIGASAGGLDSLEQLFAMVPPSTNMAFVVIQHLSPDFHSMMDELLARHTEMQVRMASNGLQIEPNQIYVLPPRKQMIVRGRRLVLTDRAPNAFQLPIDTFFRALAQDVGDQSVAVVLSGTGSDGSRGIVDIKNAGGYVLAESVASAKFDGMPHAAIATGLVDVQRTPRELGRLLGSLPPVEAELVDDQAPADLSPAESILALLHERFGIDFTRYRTTTVGRRILRRITLARVPSIEDYVDRLRSTPVELDALYRDLLIGVTQFFRDPEAFEALETAAVPAILDAVPVGEDIRVWIAACATGEEAYTVAMIFLDALAARGRPPRVRVIASDAHERSLDVAATGLYSAEQVANVSEDRLRRYFTLEGPSYRVTAALRQTVMFTRHDLTRDPPFTRIHLITCRNMLIYLQPAAQRGVLSVFHFGLAPNGYLLLGASENATALGEELTPIDARWRLYRKQRDIELSPEVARRSPPATEESGGGLIALYDHLLDMFMPPGFLVDENRTLVDSFAGAERILRTRARRPSRNLLELLEGELRMVVGGALQRVFKDGTPARYTNVPVDLDGPATATVVARAVRGGTRGVRHAVVTLNDMVRGDRVAVEAPPTTDLAAAREQLQFASSQLETSNEALQATNEELQSANEELQSANEELQSLNEELFTVNTENQRQLGELNALHTDVLHLLDDSDVGTLFLDRELRIRRFTARIAPIFRFELNDTGRHLADFAHTLVRPQLLSEIAEVERTGTPVATEIVDESNHRYFLRIVRMKDGVILTLIDITALDAARRRASET